MTAALGKVLVLELDGDSARGLIAAHRVLDVEEPAIAGILEFFRSHCEGDVACARGHGIDRAVGAREKRGLERAIGVLQLVDLDQRLGTAAMRDKMDSFRKETGIEVVPVAATTAKLMAMPRSLGNRIRDPRANPSLLVCAQGLGSQSFLNNRRRPLQESPPGEPDR